MQHEPVDLTQEGTPAAHEVGPSLETAVEAATEAAVLPHDARLGYLIGRVNWMVRRRFEIVLAEHGLTVAQYTALSVAAARPGLSSAQLARRALVTAQGMNTLVNALEAAGLIRRHPHERGGRVLRIELTEKGRSTLEVCDAQTSAAEEEIFAVLQPATRQGLLEALEELAGIHP